MLLASQMRCSSSDWTKTLDSAFVKLLKDRTSSSLFPKPLLLVCHCLKLYFYIHSESWVFNEVILHNPTMCIGCSHDQVQWVVGHCMYTVFGTPCPSHLIYILKGVAFILEKPMCVHFTQEVWLLADMARCNPSLFSHCKLWAKVLQ